MTKLSIYTAAICFISGLWYGLGQPHSVPQGNHQATGQIVKPEPMVLSVQSGGVLMFTGTTMTGTIVSGNNGVVLESTDTGLTWHKPKPTIRLNATGTTYL